MDEIVQCVDEVFEKYERAVFVDEINKCYSEMDSVYQGLHEGHSLAYRSGSSLYFGETLPWPVFFVVALSLGVLAQIHRLVENNTRIVYALLKDRVCNLHVDLWYSKYETTGVE